MNWYKNLMISKKIMTGFGGVLLLFLVSAVMELNNLNNIAKMQDYESQQAKNAITVDSARVQIDEIDAAFDESIQSAIKGLVVFGLISLLPA